MNRIILKVLIVISIIIIVLGIYTAKSVKEEVISNSTSAEEVYMDGTNVTPFTEAFKEIGTGLFGFLMILYSIIAVSCIWAIYGIIILILAIIKKIKLKRKNI